MTVLLSLAQAASRLGISRQRLHSLIQAGRIPAIRIGNGWFIETDTLDNWKPAPNGRPRKAPPAAAAD